MDMGRRKERPEGGPIADALAVAHPALFYRTTVWKLDTQDRSPSSEEEAAEKIDAGLRAARAQVTLEAALPALDLWPTC